MLARTKFQIAPKFFIYILPVICVTAIGLGFGVGMVQSQYQSHQHKVLPKDL